MSGHETAEHGNRGLPETPPNTHPDICLSQPAGGHCTLAWSYLDRFSTLDLGLPPFSLEVDPRGP